MMRVGVEAYSTKTLKPYTISRRPTRVYTGLTRSTEMTVVGDSPGTR